ncbi:hypothetical protein FB45DRAFT_914218 [Roridomyces roridus]|uniref:Uncharacterized protein n=1 Tax=Roridomyces roridus TaxID=1738132 RepID=A0AAD7BXJ4_9AGAR|nr:hypothetical protein FB45DRAFT_914218 [Roridomyces roridus]
MAPWGGPSTSNNSRTPPLKPPGIIKLPAPFPEEEEEEDSPESLVAALRLRDDSTASLPALPASRPVPERTLSRRTSTSTSSLNVKFAPLPQLAPRKRRSTTPLGVASRGAIMRRRRAGTPGFDMNGDPIQLPPVPPVWTQEEIERHTQRIMAERNGLGRMTAAHGNEVDDPFSSLGRFVKGVWRKVNKPGSGEGHRDGLGNGHTTIVEGGMVVAERTVLAPISGDNIASPEEVGGVWEEEVGDRFLNISQTETIVEGQFPWSAAQLKPDEDRESTSDDGSGKEHNLSSTEGTEEGSSTQDSYTVESER